MAIYAKITKIYTPYLTSTVSCWASILINESRKLRVKIYIDHSLHTTIKKLESTAARTGNRAGAVQRRRRIQELDAVFNGLSSLRINWPFRVGSWPSQASWRHLPGTSLSVGTRNQTHHVGSDVLQKSHRRKLRRLLRSLLGFVKVRCWLFVVVAAFRAETHSLAHFSWHFWLKVKRDWDSRERERWELDEEEMVCVEMMMERYLLEIDESEAEREREREWRFFKKLY